MAEDKTEEQIKTYTPEIQQAIRNERKIREEYNSLPARLGRAWDDLVGPPPPNGWGANMFDPVKPLQFGERIKNAFQEFFPPKNEDWFAASDERNEADAAAGHRLAEAVKRGEIKLTDFRVKEPISIGDGESRRVTVTYPANTVLLGGKLNPEPITGGAIMSPQDIQALTEAGIPQVFPEKPPLKVNVNSFSDGVKGDRQFKAYEACRVGLSTGAIKVDGITNPDTVNKQQATEFCFSAAKATPAPAPAPAQNAGPEIH